MVEYTSIEEVDADIKLISHELSRLRKIRKELIGRPVKPLMNIEPNPMTDAEWEDYQALDELKQLMKPRVDLFGPPKPKKPRPYSYSSSFTGIKVTDLPAVITADQFEAYLEAKREEAPKNDFWTKPEEVKAWLQGKGVIVTCNNLT